MKQKLLIAFMATCTALTLQAQNIALLGHVGWSGLDEDAQAAYTWAMANYPNAEFVQMDSLINDPYSVYGYDVIWWHYDGDGGNAGIPAVAVDSQLVMGSPSSMFDVIYHNFYNYQAHAGKVGVLLTGLATQVSDDWGISNDGGPGEVGKAFPGFTSGDEWGFLAENGAHPVFHDLSNPFFTLKTGTGLREDSKAWWGRPGVGWFPNANGTQTGAFSGNTLASLNWDAGHNILMAIGEYPNANDPNANCIVIGAGAYDWHLSGGANEDSLALQLLTANAINYLAGDPACVDRSLSASNSANYQATINFSTFSTRFNLRYRLIGSTTWTTRVVLASGIVGAGLTNFNLTNLTPGNYEYKVADFYNVETESCYGTFTIATPPPATFTQKIALVGDGDLVQQDEDVRAAYNWALNQYGADAAYVSFNDINTNATALDSTEVIFFFWDGASSSIALPAGATSSSTISNINQFLSNGGKLFLAGLATQAVSTWGIGTDGGPGEVGKAFPGFTNGDEWGFLAENPIHPVFHNLSNPFFTLKTSTGLREDSKAWWGRPGVGWFPNANGTQTGAFSGNTLASLNWDAGHNILMTIGEYESSPGVANVVVLSAGAFDWHLSGGVNEDSVALHQLTDNVIMYLRGTPNCEDYNVSASNTANNTLTLSWSAISGVSTYEIQYRSLGSSTWSSATTSSTTIDITGLIPGNWEYRVGDQAGSVVFSCIESAGVAQPSFVARIAFVGDGALANLDNDAQTAYAWGLRNYPDAAYLSFTDLNAINGALDSTELLWWHFDETSMPAAAMNANVIAKIRAYQENGGALLLTGSATLAVTHWGIDAVAPGEVGKAIPGFTNGDRWGFLQKDTTHPIFNNLPETFFTLGTTLPGNPGLREDTKAWWGLPGVGWFPNQGGAFGGTHLASLNWDVNHNVLMTIGEYTYSQDTGTVVVISAGAIDWHLANGYNEDSTSLQTLTANAFSYLLGDDPCLMSPISASATTPGNYRVNLNWNSTGASVYNVWFREVGDTTWTTLLAPDTFRVLRNRRPGDYEFYVSEVGGGNPSCVSNFTVECADDIAYSYNVFQAPELGRRGRATILNTTGGKRKYNIALVNSNGDTTLQQNRRIGFFTNLDDDTYTIYVTDAFDCLADSVGQFTINAMDTNKIPNLINAPNNSPNGFRPTWNSVDGVINYQLRVLNVTDGTLVNFITGITDTMRAVTGLTPGKLYRFNVRSRYNNGTANVNSGYSNPVSRNLPAGGNKDGESSDLAENAAELISIYPNPVAEVLFVSAPTASDVALMDLNGKVIAVRSIDGQEVSFDMSALASGVYMVRITNADQVTIQKVVKR